MRLVLIISLFLAGCSASTDTPPADTSGTYAPAADGGYRLLVRGLMGPGADPEARRRAPFVLTARDPATFNSLWSQWVDGSSPSPVDFSTELVVFLLLGPQATGGYEIEPIRVEQEGSTLRVHANLIQPMTSDIVTQAFTSPYAVIAVPARDATRIEWIGGDGRLIAVSGE